MDPRFILRIRIHNTASNSAEVPKIKKIADPEASAKMLVKNTFYPDTATKTQNINNDPF
jgi:hypothetical protein